jgi:hypothetical protein
MDVEKSYAAISWFFNPWVRLIEYHTRKMEVLESVHLGPRRLIISPPTDAGIPLLTRANAQGETELLCFSDRIEQIASQYRSGGRLWAWVFDRLTFLSNGCYPVTITAHLTRNGFRILKDVPAVRLGFPARYSVSEKPTPVA